MARRHPEPTGTVEVSLYADLDPVLSIGGVADYYGVKKQLAAKWAREMTDWPSPFATPRSGALYRTDQIIAWGVKHERRRAEGPRPSGDTRPPSVQKARRRALATTKPRRSAA